MGTQLISLGVRGKYTELQRKESERAYLYDSGRTNYLTLALMRGQKVTYTVYSFE